MYTTSQAVAALIESSCRTFRMICELGDGRRLGSRVVRAGSSQASTTTCSDDIELGAVCSAQWDLEIFEEGRIIDILGQKIRLYIYLADLGASGTTTYGFLSSFTWRTLSHETCGDIADLAEIVAGEYIPLGEYTCIRCSRASGVCKATLSDKLYASDKIYTPALLPTTVKSSQVENDICRQLGIVNGNSFENSERLLADGGVRLYADGHVRLRSVDLDFPINIATIPKGTTMRQMLSYIASVNGQFGCIDREGRYVRRWYGSPVKELDPDTIDSPMVSEQENLIAGIICYVSEEITLTRGDTSGSSGRVLEFRNPYMTAKLLKPMFLRLQRMRWNTADIRMRLGDPRVDPGDVLTYTDGEGITRSIPVMSLGFTFDGGLSADISAAGLSVEEQLEY